MRTESSTLRPLAQTILLLFWSATGVWASEPGDPTANATNIFAPASTPAKSIADLSVFALVITGIIFAVVFELLAYSLVKFRERATDAGREPAQVYGSTQIELAWTVISDFDCGRFVPGFCASHPRDSGRSRTAGRFTGHRHRTSILVGVSLSEARNRNGQRAAHSGERTWSSDANISAVAFGRYRPQLLGTGDCGENGPRSEPPQQNVDGSAAHGSFLGQCAQYCGVQHAKMLRVSVDGPADFAVWVHAQQQPAVEDAGAAAGRRIFEGNACMNCHTIAGTAANGRFGPDLTHLMSRATIAAGAAQNTRDSLRLWIKNPSAIKPGSLMPAMQLSDADLDAVVSYMETLR